MNEQMYYIANDDGTISSFAPYQFDEKAIKANEEIVQSYDGKYYRMAQDINSTTSTTYQPGTGTESLYTLIDLAPDGIRIWHTVTNAEDSFTLGELCHYPDAEGPIYVSKRVGNTSVPGTDQWWGLQE